MNHFQCTKGTFINYRGDGSGDAHLAFGDQKIQIPCEDLIEFVGQMVVIHAISKLERVSVLDDMIKLVGQLTVDDAIHKLEKANVLAVWNWLKRIK